MSDPSNPYGQNPYGQQPQAPQFHGGAGPQPHPQGTTILVLGILGVICFQILGPVAWVMGSKTLKEIDANPGAYSNRENVKWGKILGIIGTVLLVLGILFSVLAAGMFGLAGSGVFEDTTTELSSY